MDYGKLDNLLKGSKKTLFYSIVIPINAMGQVLLGERKSDGIWTTPGGGSELNETPEQTAIREAWEEAGIAIVPSMLELVAVKPAPDGKPVHCYMVRMNQENFTVRMDPDREVASWNWYSRENLPEGLSRPKNANRLETISQALMKFFGLMKSEDKSRAHWVMVGTKVEMEHTDDREKAKKIALDHLHEDPDYYKDWDNKEKILFEEKAPKLNKSDVESLIEKLNKGGEGSGVKGHMTAKKPGLHLVKPGEAPPVNKVQAHLDMLQNGGALPGVHTTSGKPIVNSMDAARAQGYKLEDYTDAMNVHYNMGQKVNQMIEKMKMAGKAAPKEGVAIAKFHQKKMKEFMGARDRLADRQKDLASAIDRKKKEVVKNSPYTKKSVTQMGSGLGDRDLDIGAFAQAQDKADSKWMEMLHVGMDNFQFGDEPRSFQLPKGMLHLCKVDDGLYSGFFTKQEIVADGMLEDNAKVRIERQTIPELVMFMMAQEWIVDHLQHQPEPAQSPVDDSELMKLDEKLSSPAMIEPEKFSSNEQRIRMLELIHKLIG